MPLSGIGRQTCSVARTIHLIGDPWTLMLLRELFLGSRRFDEFQAYTEASPHLLSVRLRGLVDAGIVEMRAYQERPVRYEYHLTDKGVALWPVITALREWGDRWNKLPGAAPVRVTHRGCGGVTRMKHECSACGQDVDPHGVSVTLSREARRERQARAHKPTRTRRAQ
jgi:DNA-binding HxlR family transcriptional regulator